MTATDELRKLLDERGVEHEDSELIYHGNGSTTHYTEWGGNDDGDGANVYVEYMDGTVLRMFDATPEQAIAATLERGTCHNTSYRIDESRFHCSECEFGCWVKDVSDGRDKLPNYCPFCGARVERREQ